MIAVFKQARRVLARIELRNPERLWVHYCVAISAIVALLFGSHLLDRVEANNGHQASEAIEMSTQQLLHTQKIVETATEFVVGNAADSRQLDKAIIHFQDLHHTIANSGDLPAAVQQRLFDGDAPLYQELRRFAALAGFIAQAAGPQQIEALTHLQDQFLSGGLQEELASLTSLFSDQLAIDTRRILEVRLALFFFSAAVLLAEAFLIFLPAHRLVRSTFRKLRRQAEILRKSRAKIEEMNAKLVHMAGHDPLTDLPNRKSLTEFITNAMADKSIHESTLLLVGLDDFKTVNDTLGADYGDALLIAVGQALQSCIDEEDFVAYMGNDEFVLISAEPAKVIIARIMASLDQPFMIKGRRVATKASIGYLTLGPQTGGPLEPVADASVALQSAKSAGGKTARQFTADLQTEQDCFQNLQIELIDAIKNGEIEPWFQPQIQLSDGHLHGAEVLARWRHPTRGLLSPFHFLPAAERAGLMIDLDHAVWTAALRYARAWQDEGIWRPCVSLNVAPETIADPHFLERFLLVLQRSGLGADQVIVELLETTFIGGDDDMVAINIDGLAESGVAVELDDFGTGFASLSRLAQLPLTGVKLDRSLVSPLPDHGADSIVRAVLALAAELGLLVIAEGVEETAQAKHLDDRGCAVAQGYGFGKPMPANEFQSWLQANVGKAVNINQNLVKSA
jgi:diguanylate cyclase (GGDEF)-like protein